MVWAYVMENGFGAEEHSNQPVFELIQKVGVSDEQIVFEQTEDRPELRKLLERLHEEDILIVRSVADLADDVINLIRVFQTLAEKQVSLCDCEEAFLSGKDYLDVVTKFTQLYVLFQKKKQQAGYKKACEEGRVGRPAIKQKEIEQAMNLYWNSDYTIRQIAVLTGVSKSTLYRALKEQTEDSGNAGSSVR